MTGITETEEKTKATNPQREYQVIEEDISIIEAGADVLLEPVPPENYDLTYACLLIPRFPSHLIKGDLALSLPEWLKKTCISYGWRLDSTIVQETHLQWVMRVAPSTSVMRFIQTIRTETSTLIFENFPKFKKDNTGSDFWAPSHLVMQGSQPHPPEMIKHFTRIARRQQGISTPL